MRIQPSRPTPKHPKALSGLALSQQRGTGARSPMPNKTANETAHHTAAFK
ncbi:hypothetical protein [Vibrio aerogenes]|nr:hypothetical protein [Vibrio aerogenes]